MSITTNQLLLYSAALFVLWLTPGPVWLAVLARGIAGGLRAVIALALGVALGDFIWALLAILSLGAFGTFYDHALSLVRYFGVGLFVIMGLLIIRYADSPIDENKTVARAGIWAGFLAGLVAVTANPKAILFYLGLFPNFFDIRSLNNTDIVMICLLSALVPFLGNLILGQSIDSIRGLLHSQTARRRMNITAGIAMIVVGLLLGLA